MATTKTTLTKQQLQEFATAGVAQRITAIEQELATYHRHWPDLFISATAPQLLKATLKVSTNGAGPEPTTKKTRKKQPKGVHAMKIAAQRQATADYLKKFSTKDPKPSPHRMTGSLIRYGYLKRKGDGMVRTSKHYEP